MRRSLIAAFTAVLVSLVATPAFAQAVDTPATTEPAPPVTDIAPGSVEVTKTELSVDGKTVEAVPSGVEVTLTLRLRNAGDAALENVNVVLSDAREGVRFTDAEAAIGDLASGEEAEGVFAFVLEGQCFEFVGVAGEAVYDGGAAPLKIAIPVSCPGPRLSLTNVFFDGGDGDDVAEPGETLRVSFELVNNGKDAARNVRASVKVSGDGLKATATDLEWPDIAPGGSARNTTPMILSISDDAQRQKACEPLPQPLPAEEDPAIIVDDMPLPPDSAVSSDGTVSSDGSTSSGSAGDSGSAPGSEPADGGGVPGSTGTGATTTEEPPIAIEPLPAQVEPTPGTGSGTEPGGAGTEPGTIEPDPIPPEKTAEPQPLPVEPKPEPAPDEQPVAVQLLLTVKATDHETSAEWSNQTFCLMEQGVATDALAGAKTREDASNGGKGAALPVSVALGISALAVAAHRKIVL